MSDCEHLPRIARRASASGGRRAPHDTFVMETHTKVSPFKDIKSFFSPSAAAGDGGAGKQLKVHSKQSETRPNCGKLDFASTVPVVEQAAEDTPWCSNAATCGAKPVRQALGTVANGATGGVSAAPASQNNQNRRDSDLTAQETQDGNSPAPSMGFTTPALGLRATHVNMDASDTPLATQTHPVRPRYTRQVSRKSGCQRFFARGAKNHDSRESKRSTKTNPLPSFVPFCFGFAARIRGCRRRRIACHRRKRKTSV